MEEEHVKAIVPLLIVTIQMESLSHYDDPLQRAEQLIKMYSQGPEERRIMDDIFLELTGWTFKVLMERAYKRFNNNEKVEVSQ